MFYRDNWLSWSYNGVEYGPKTDPFQEFEYHFRKVITRPIKSHHEELLENGRVIRDTFSGPLDLMFSGGIDSEVILRVYHELKIPINVFIFKYENNYNHREFNLACKICESLNVRYKVIDFNLQKFFENDAYDIWKVAYFESSPWVVHNKLTEYLDNTPIIGSGEPYCYRGFVDKIPKDKFSYEINRDYAVPSKWYFQLNEAPRGWAIYHKTVGRPVITDWHEYSPEIIVSYFQLQRARDLFNDLVTGKVSNITSKALIHKDYWPDVQLRHKLTGFEGDLVWNGKESKPDFMLEFERTHIHNKVTSRVFSYSEEQILDLIF
jgi:hypothetical protein